jgi:hypothetical protein
MAGKVFLRSINLGLIAVAISLGGVNPVFAAG